MRINPSSFLLVLTLALYPFPFIHSQENHPPVVKIIRPEATSGLETGKTIPYEIEVEDKEDGYSIYDEIESSQVFLELRILPGVGEAQKVDSLVEPKGLTLIKVHKCFTCHHVRKKYVGPSYLDISQKHQGKTSFLTHSIKEGSQGRWGDTAIMPAHPFLEVKEVKAMADWIAALYEDTASSDILVGTAGVIQIDPAHSGKYLWIRASYRDQGSRGSDPLFGKISHYFLLH